MTRISLINSCVLFLSERQEREREREREIERELGFQAPIPSKLPFDSYFFQRTGSPPGPRLPNWSGNTHPRNYYNLMSKKKDIPFLFKLMNYIVT